MSEALKRCSCQLRKLAGARRFRLQQKWRASSHPADEISLQVFILQKEACLSPVISALPRLQEPQQRATSSTGLELMQQQIASIRSHRTSSHWHYGISAG